MSILSYLRFSLTDQADVQEFERDLHAMLRLAQAQPGYRWTEMGASTLDKTVYVVVSEWDDVERVRAWEHIEEHEGVMEKWEPFYREPLSHRRFEPWVRPTAADVDSKDTLPS